MKKNTGFVHPDDLERMKDYHYARREGGEAPKRYEFRFIDREGNIKNVLINIDMIPGTKKSVASLIDISKNKRISNVLKVTSEINELIFRDRNPENILDSLCQKLSSVYPAVFVFVKDGSKIRCTGIEGGELRKAINRCHAILKA